MTKANKLQRLFDFADFFTKKAEIYYGFKIYANLSMDEINDQFFKLKEELEDLTDPIINKKTVDYLEEYLNTLDKLLEKGEELLEEPGPTANAEFVDYKNAVRSQFKTLQAKIPFFIYNHPDLPPSFARALMNEEGTDMSGLASTANQIRLFIIKVNDFFIEAVKSFTGDESEDFTDEDETFKSETRDLLEQENREGTAMAEEGAGVGALDERDLFGKKEDGGSAGFGILGEDREKMRSYMRNRYSELQMKSKFNPESFLSVSNINLNPAEVNGIIDTILNNREIHTDKETGKKTYVTKLRMKDLIKDLRSKYPDLAKREIDVTKALVMNLLGKRAYTALLDNSRKYYNDRKQNDPAFSEYIKDRNRKSNKISDFRRTTRLKALQALQKAKAEGNQELVDLLEDQITQYEQSVLNLNRVNKKEINKNIALDILKKRTKEKPIVYKTKRQSSELMGSSKWLEGYTDRIHYNLENTIKGFKRNQSKQDTISNWQVQLYESIPKVAVEIAEFKKTTPKKDVVRRKELTAIIVGKFIGALATKNPVIKFINEMASKVNGPLLKASAMKKLGSQIDLEQLSSKPMLQTALNLLKITKDFNIQVSKYDEIIGDDFEYRSLGKTVETNLEIILEPFLSTENTPTSTEGTFDSMDTDTLVQQLKEAKQADERTLQELHEQLLNLDIDDEEQVNSMDAIHDQIQELTSRIEEINKALGQ